LQPLILVLHGPNLNLLGEREPDIYGSESLESINERLRNVAAGYGFKVEIYQSNDEGRLIDILHEYRSIADGVVFNPGAFTHYSLALRDAISAINLPVVEVHLSNIHGREGFRRTSVLAPVCLAQVSGFGAQSYELGLIGLVKKLKENTNACEGSQESSRRG